MPRGIPCEDEPMARQSRGLSCAIADFPESSRCIREVGHRLGNWFRGHSQSRVSPRMYVTVDGSVITPKIATKRQRTKIALIGAAASEKTSVVNPEHRIGRPATQGVGAAA